MRVGALLAFRSRGLQAADWCSPLHAANVQMIPDTSTASGTIRNARASELRSEITPMSGGDGTSPSRCMTRIESATAELYREALAADPSLKSSLPQQSRAALS